MAMAVRDGGDRILLAMVEQPPEQTTTWDMTLDDGPVPVPWSTVPLRDSRYRGDHPAWPALRKIQLCLPRHGELLLKSTSNSALASGLYCRR